MVENQLALPSSFCRIAPRHKLLELVEGRLLLLLNHDVGPQEGRLLFLLYQLVDMAEFQHVFGAPTDCNKCHPNPT